ncbi:NADPH-dependent FMN reductase, partial [Acinetobacter sp. YK3]|uniref:NADPH-dependent FMN reductase n=1 Tax=Acinetobacter sp. YK3 TaxID=1860097 RepID=UPI00084C0DA4
MKILAISGSAREASTNTALLRAMSELAPQSIEISVFHELNLLPVFSPDEEGEKTPVAVQNLIAVVADADGIIISSPEYIRAIPGGLKNAIDWMVSRIEIIDKPIALVHASIRGDDMLNSLRRVLSTVSGNFFEYIFLRFS